MSRAKAAAALRPSNTPAAVTIIPRPEEQRAYLTRLRTECNPDADLTALRHHIGNHAVDTPRVSK